MGGTLSSIYSNISYGLHSHMDAMIRLQEQAATGSRINRVSDAPGDAYRLLGLRCDQRSLQDYLKRTADTTLVLQFCSESIITPMLEMVTKAKTSISQVMSGTYSEEARLQTAEEINERLENMVSLANAECADQYLFGGSATGSAPYTAQRDEDGRITEVVYQGSSYKRQIEVSAGVEVTAFYAGEDVFSSDNRDQPVFTGSTGAAGGTGTSNIKGFAWLTVTHNGTNYELSIDDGVTKVVVTGAETNQAVTNPATGEVLYVDATGISSTGAEFVSIPGTYNVFNALIAVRDILENEKGLSGTQLEQLRNHSLGVLDEASEILTRHSVKVGSEIGFLTGLENNLKEMIFSTEDEAGALEQADITEIAIGLSRHQVLYQMSLSLAGRILSVSLLDFIK